MPRKTTQHPHTVRGAERKGEGCTRPTAWSGPGRTRIMTPSRVPRRRNSSPRGRDGVLQAATRKLSERYEDEEVDESPPP